MLIAPPLRLCYTGVTKVVPKRAATSLPLLTILSIVDRIFTLSEANQLIPELEVHLKAVQSGKAALLQVKPEIKKASAKAVLNGGSVAGPYYIRALEEITRHFHTIEELGVHLKDLELGLCDFPYRLNGRTIYLCWKLGESEIGWWHEIDTGYRERQSLDKLEG